MEQRNNTGVRAVFKSKGFEDLQVWRLSKDLAVYIYKITNDFPAKEQFGLTSQIRRSVVSISSNIAEGSSRNSNLEFARFVSIASGSAAELKTQLIIAKEIGFLKENDYLNSEEQINSISRMLKALRTSMKN